MNEVQGRNVADDLNFSVFVYSLLQACLMFTVSLVQVRVCRAGCRAAPENFLSQVYLVRRLFAAKY